MTRTRSWRRSPSSAPVAVQRDPLEPGNRWDVEHDPLRRLSQLIRELRAQRLAVAAEAARLRKVCDPRKVVPTFTEEQLQTLLAQPDVRTFIAPRDLTFMLLLLDTGLRLSEAIGLRVDDVGFRTMTVTVMGKGSKERTVAFSPAFAKRRAVDDAPWMLVQRRDTGTLVGTQRRHVGRFGAPPR